jgi:hypothetical protein
MMFFLLVFSAPLRADRILVISDSWAPGIASGLKTVLRENGYMNITVEGFQNMGAATQLGSADGLDYVSHLLNARPDTIVVHLQVGAHDWLASGWTPAWSIQSENDLIGGIIQNVERVVDHILSLRPDIQILWSSYDFPRPIERGGTPAENNRFLIKMAEQQAQFALTKPSLSVVNAYGTLQLTFGFDGVQHTEFDPDFVIPPGDPSLPDPGFPSPIAPFLFDDPLHVGLAGSRAVARAQYDRYYATQLGGESFHINAGLNDAWVNFDTLGQGFFFNVFPELGKMFVAMFTYDTQRPPEGVAAILGGPGQRWVTGIGDYADNAAVINLELTTAGIFNSILPEPDQGQGYGTFTIQFSDCNHATLTYNFPSLGLFGVIELTRATPDNVALCEALNLP